MSGTDRPDKTKNLIRHCFICTIVCQFYRIYSYYLESEFSVVNCPHCCPQNTAGTAGIWPSSPSLFLVLENFFSHKKFPKPSISISSSTGTGTLSSAFCILILLNITEKWYRYRYSLISYRYILLFFYLLMRYQYQMQYRKLSISFSFLVMRNFSFKLTLFKRKDGQQRDFW